MNPTAQKAGITGGTLAAIILGAIASAMVISAIVILIMARRHAQSQRILSRRRLCKFIFAYISLLLMLFMTPSV